MSLWDILQVKVIHSHPHTISHTNTQSHTYRHASLPISTPTHTCFLSVSALTPCVFRAASLPSPPTANCCTNTAAAPKDTICAYWRATLLVTKGHTVKILNLWRTRALSHPNMRRKHKKGVVSSVYDYIFFLHPSSSDPRATFLLVADAGCLTMYKRARYSVQY